MTELEYSEFLKGDTNLEQELSALEHYGIPGMKWGVRRTPEQLGHKRSSTNTNTNTNTNKKRNNSIFSKFRGNRKTKKTTSVKKKIEEKKEESKEEIRKKLLNSTDPSYIYKHRKLLSSSELQDRIDRIGKEEKIKSLIRNPSDDVKKKMKRAEDFMKSAAVMAESATKIYNAYDSLTSGNRRNTNNTNNSNANNSNQNRRRRRNQSSNASSGNSNN